MALRCSWASKIGPGTCLTAGHTQGMRSRAHARETPFCPVMGTRTKLLLTVLMVTVILPVEALCSGPTADCTAFRRELDLKKQLLTEYTAALPKLDLKGDRVMVSLLNHKIDELRREIEESEKTGNCLEDRTAPPAKAALGPVRSDDALFSGKSCRDLRNILIQLLRKSFSLERRRFSMLSEMSTEEITELQEIRDSLRSVRALLKTKCPPQPSGESEKSRRGPHRRSAPRGDE